MIRRWMRGSKGLQTLEWVAIGLVILALIGAVALVLAHPSTGAVEAVAEAIARMFRCLTDVSACIGLASGATPVSIWAAVGECFMHPERCIVRWWTCWRQGTCGPADWVGLLGLLPWLLTPFGVLAVGIRAVPIPWWKRVGDRVYSGSIKLPGCSSDSRDIGKGQPLSPEEQIGLIVTGGAVVIGFTFAELTLAILGVAAAHAGPPGVVFDILIIFPIELFLIDMEVSIIVSIYRSISTGKKQPVILLPPWGLEE